MLGMTLVTRQTGPQGQTVWRLRLIEQGWISGRSFIPAIIVDVRSLEVCLYGYLEGGNGYRGGCRQKLVSGKIHKVFIDPVAWLTFAGCGRHRPPDRHCGGHRGEVP